MRRQNKTSEDTTTLFKDIHASLNFNFTDIIDGFTKNKVSDMNGYLEATNDGTFLVGISLIPCAVGGTIRYNHVDAPDGAVSFFIKERLENKEKKYLSVITRQDYRNLHVNSPPSYVVYCTR